MNAVRINNCAQTTMFAPALTRKKNATTNNAHTAPISSNSANVLLDKNYACLQVKKNNDVSFKGALPPAAPKTLGQKVGNLFDVIKTNDVIVAGPTIKNVVESIDKHIDSFKTVIKRIFFVEDKSLKQAIGFRKNLEQKEILNLTDDALVIKDAKNKTVSLKSGESGYLLSGDRIKTSGQEIEITEGITPGSSIRDNCKALIDFNAEASPSIQKLNKRMIKNLQLKQNRRFARQPLMFADVGGQDEVIKSLKKNILFPIKYPELNTGASTNKAVLLYGPPGTGKSLVAEATANEAGAWYKKINASELDSKYVGESEEHWRDLFNEARENQPAIIFIDEFDAIAKKRGGQDVYGDKTLNTILALMSDAEKSGDEIYMIAATNNRQALDAAATRSGRFGLSLEVGAPDLKGTKQILEIHTKKQAMDTNFDYEQASKLLHNEKATGADIAAITSEARNNAREREHIFEKMDNGTYKREDMDKVRINNEDFAKAVESFKKGKETTKPRNPIGYTSTVYKR